jgi:hypothetical protein
MKNKQPRTKIVREIEKADLKQNAEKKKESKKRAGSGRGSSRVHPIGELASQYNGAEDALESVGDPKIGK